MNALKILQVELNRGFPLKSCELYPELNMTLENQYLFFQMIEIQEILIYFRDMI
jgi:hypothetical protein